MDIRDIALMDKLDDKSQRKRFKKHVKKNDEHSIKGNKWYEQVGLADETRP